MDQSFLVEFGIILIIAAGFGIIARFFKQPLILAYLISGVLIGPFAFGLLKNTNIIETYASIGTVFLLFLIGLELNPRRLFEVGWSALTVSIAQIVLAGAVYYLAALRFGLSGTGAFYLAAAFTFSSTAIIVTLLSNRRDLDSLHGKMLVGILLIQDVLAMVILAITSGFNSAAANSSIGLITFQTAVRALILIVLIYLVSQYILPATFHRIARSQELLFICSLAWCFLLVIAAVALGFSPEIGAFLAGVSLAQLPYSPHVAAKTKPLRDFFIMIFFIYLGTNLVFKNIGQVIWPAIGFSILILMVNPLVVMLTMGILGFRRRTSFITGVTLTQISEFSFIVIVLGTKLKILPPEINTLTSLVAVITVFISTYLISNSTKIFHVLRPYLRFLDSNTKEDLHHLPSELTGHVILVGRHRIGKIIFEALKQNDKKIIVVDFDPKAIQDLIENKEPCVYGDAMDHDILESLNVESAEMVISTINKFEENEMLTKTYKKLNSKIKIILISDSEEDAVDLYKAGADLVIIPTQVSGDYLTYLLEQINKDEVSFKELKSRELKTLSEHTTDTIFDKFVKEES